MMHPKDRERLMKVLMISKITFLEKFEKIYLTIYYKLNMMLILTFDTEKECDDYLKKLKALVDYYVSYKIKLKKYVISDKKNIRSDLKELYEFNQKLTYVFTFPLMLLSNLKLCSFVHARAL